MTHLKSDTGIVLPNRLEAINRTKGKHYPIVITFACGWAFEMKEMADMPLASTYCPCGRHLAIRYTE